MMPSLGHYPQVKITALQPVCRPVDHQRRVDCSYAHEPAGGLSQRHANFADESFIKADLSLTSEVVVDAGKYDDDFVSGISGFADQTRIVSGLSGLHIAND